MSAARSPKNDSPPAAVPRLVHEHVAGLRFDREPCHAVRTARGWRWTPLAWPFEDGSAADPADVCAIRHALGLLTARKVSAAEVRAIRRRHDSWRVPGLEVCGTMHRELSLKALAVLAHEAILQGRTCLLEVQTETKPRRDGRNAASARQLMTITGVEVEDGPVARVRALLLLDPSDAQPWACGHNARLPITHSSEIVTVHQTTGHLLRCRIGSLIEWSAQ